MSFQIFASGELIELHSSLGGAVTKPPSTYRSRNDFNELRWCPIIRKFRKVGRFMFGFPRGRDSVPAMGIPITASSSQPRAPSGLTIGAAVPGMSRLPSPPRRSDRSLAEALSAGCLIPSVLVGCGEATRCPDQPYPRWQCIRRSYCARRRTGGGARGRGLQAAKEWSFAGGSQTSWSREALWGAAVSTARLAKLIKTWPNSPGKSCRKFGAENRYATPYGVLHSADIFLKSDGEGI